MTSDESDDLELHVLYRIAKSAMPQIEEWYAIEPDGRVLGIVFYGALGTLTVDAVERKEAAGVLPIIGAIVEYAAVALENAFERWAPRLDEFFEALTVSHEANTVFSRFASERIRVGAARIGYAWEPDDSHSE